MDRQNMNIKYYIHIYYFLNLNGLLHSIHPILSMSISYIYNLERRSTDNVIMPRLFELIDLHLTLIRLVIGAH